MRKVVITGVGAISPLGNDWETVSQNLRSYKSAVREVDFGIDHMDTKLVCPVSYRPMALPVQQKKFMGKTSLLGVAAAKSALVDAGLYPLPPYYRYLFGVAAGSCLSEEEGLLQLGETLLKRDARCMNSATYIKAMPHSLASNISTTYGLDGRMIPTSCACASSSLAIGYAYEAIKNGAAKFMLAGGADSITPAFPAIFDVLRASSKAAANKTPRPFDERADGIVVGSGACFLALEDYDSAVARGAKIYAEVIGFGTTSSAKHMTVPDVMAIEMAMRLAILNSEISYDEIGYVNAHATGTRLGDAVESRATYDVFKRLAPVSSLKSYMGHTMGACGSLESWMTIMMMNEGWFAPTLNLEKVSSECAPLDYIVNEGRAIDTDIVMSNNFAFGGVNTSLIFRRHKCFD